MCNCICVYSCICTCICICICICICTCNRLLLLSSSRSTTAAVTTTTAVTILLGQLRHRKSQQSLSPGAEKCHPEKAAQLSIVVIVLPLACVELGFCRIRSHPCEGHRLRSTVVCVPPHSGGSGAGSTSTLKSAFVFSSICAT